MFDFGEELTLESSRISWLIWIQLIVFLLVLALLFCFIAIAFDPSHDTPAAIATTSTSASATAIQHTYKSLANSTDVTNRLQHMRGEENLSIKGEIATSESTRIVREEIAEREASSLYFLHPCYYFRLARVAILKCLGLDSTSESDGLSTQKRRKRKES